MKEYLAFDVGGTSVKYALCNEEGEVSSASKFKHQIHWIKCILKWKKSFIIIQM